MKVALNELTNLCRAAMEGAGYMQGDCEDAADAAVWLESVGLDGILALCHLLEAPARKQMVTRTIPAAGAYVRLLDERCLPGLATPSLAAELAIAGALAHGMFSIEVTHTVSPRLALYGMRAAARYGMRITTVWRDQAGEHWAGFDPGEMYPRYSMRSDEATTLEDGCLTILCAAPAWDGMSGQTGSVAPEGCIRAVVFAEREHAALWHGIDVDTSRLELLRIYKNSVLVEATAASRMRGAGGEDDGF